ncbi:hypothetical protein LY76DRAFT_596447 [Colletotrichum caudatum]|nr:hypothetical protein LY76DRAFT_596447 [Colletotrichum caudatum]
MATEPGPPKRSRGKRVSAQHTLERVRNNQRRHRARQKEYTEALETKLGNAERTISALEQRVGFLQSELAQLRCRSSSAVCSSITHAGQRGTSPTSLLSDQSSMLRPSETIFDEDAFDATVLSTALPVASRSLGGLSSEPQMHISADICALVDDIRDTGATSPGIRSLELIAGSRPSTLSPSYYYASFALDPSPTMLPARSTGADGSLPTSAALDGSWMQMDSMIRAPSPTSPLCLPGHVFRSTTEGLSEADVDREPTVLCSQAYALISRRNAKNLSAEDIATWLWTGFGASPRAGEGCRVTTNLLSSLLEFISIA